MTNQKSSLHAIFLTIFAGREKRISESTRKEQPEKMWLLFCLADWLCALFPSPCGVLVLKFRKISRENTAGQSPRRIHIIYCALIESSMNLLPSLAFWRTSSVMSAPASTMTTPLSILMVRVAFLPRRKRR